MVAMGRPAFSSEEAVADDDFEDMLGEAAPMGSKAPKRLMGPGIGAGSLVKPPKMAKAAAVAPKKRKAEDQMEEADADGKSMSAKASSKSVCLDSEMAFVADKHTAGTSTKCLADLTFAHFLVVKKEGENRYQQSAKLRGVSASDPCYSAAQHLIPPAYSIISTSASIRSFFHRLSK